MNFKPIETVLRACGRVGNLHGGPLTIDRLGERAEDVKRAREAEYDTYQPIRAVDVFSHPTVHAVLLKRARAWCEDVLGAPARHDGVFQATILNLPRVSLAFLAFDWHPLDKVSLICVPDLLWCSGHYEVGNPANHCVLENFT